MRTITTQPNPVLSLFVLTAIAVLHSANSFADEPNGPANNNENRVDLKSSDVRVPIESVVQRYKNPLKTESPDFQRHVSPLLGRMGCNGRSCHGSFQGQGGFQLSLFGYDFEADHKALLNEGRVDVDQPSNSLILTKPTDEDNHEGGMRYEVGSWQFNLIKRWIDEGAKTEKSLHKLKQLVVEPSNLQLVDRNKQVQLKAIAHWEDGTVEDVTPLCRFQSNNDSIAAITETGSVSTDIVPGDTHVVVFYDNAVVPIPVVHPIKGNSIGRTIAAPTRVDQLTSQKWKALGIQPSEPASDEMFLRRVSIDITGTLPTPDEIREFVADANPEKRKQKIDELMESPAYAAWWTTFFCDMTENNTTQLRNLAYDNNLISNIWYEWIHERVKNNVPYDEMIAGIVTGTSRDSGESYADYCEKMSNVANGKTDFSDLETMPFYWMRREFQTRETRAISFAHAFLGLRIQCAQCHKHPFDQWTQNDFEEFAKFFSGVSLQNYNGGRTPEDKKDFNKILEDLDIDPKEKNRGNLRKKIAAAMKKGETVPFGQLKVHEPKPTKEEANAFKKILQKAKKQKKKLAVKKPRVESARLLGAETVTLADHADIREPVIEWMRRSDNPFFARALVNRVWARYFGVGIVDPADDLNMANPPSNKPLLDYLATEFVKNNYDLKWLHREIANSKTYQLSWHPNATNENDRRNFSRALPRRLPAEVVFDAVASAASNSQTNRGFRTAVDNRAISIPGTAANGYGRKTGADSAFALQIFGRSERSSSCDCDRSEETSLMQTVYLQNDRDIHLMLQHKNSWINQMAAKYNASGVSDKERGQLKQGLNRIKNYQKQKTALGKQLESAKQSLKRAGEDNNRNRKAQSRVKTVEKQIAKINANIKNTRKKIEPVENKIKEAKIQKDKMDIGEVVAEAYLRTLSRFPTDEEKQRCIAHINEEKDLFKGVTGVMWALVNTKEFIVNH